ncbi:unnamed protein product [Oikopleura dioica]|uniref:4Fe-4S ferredoxin-type domain-containing protein n=1 Tax=Oikopleura dioica TaxID=34765 RepID=E4XS47_OIKDI|nr:unnamed protein product [Oikopleura dioica]
MARFWNIFVIQEMRFLLIIFINLAQAALRQRDICNDQEINNECLVVCDGEFFECAKNCENSECSRKCFEELDVCENSCPCGADCPTGCVDCPEHPLCEDECEDAQLNNNDYKICLNEAIYELDFCLKICPPEIGCHNSCYENYTQMLFLCPCIEQERCFYSRHSEICRQKLFTKRRRIFANFSYYEHQKAETLSATGWTALPNHPKRISVHSLVGLENQSMLLIGGRDYGNGGADQSRIWQLKDENWSKIGELLQADFYGSAIYIDRSVYYFGYRSPYAIQRLDFNETEDLQNVARIGNQPGGFFLPVLFHTVSDYCI